MILDNENLVSNGQAVTATANSEDVIDLKKTGLNIGTGRTVRAFLQVDVLPVSAGSSTLTVTIVSSDATNLSSPTTHYTTTAVAKATMVAGYTIFDIGLPSGTYKRYLGYVYTVAVADFSAGNFTGGLVLDTQAQSYYDSGLNMGGI